MPRVARTRNIAGSVSLIALLCAASPAHAQLLNLGDVIAELTQLDSEVTLQGQVIATLDGVVDANTQVITTLQTDLTALQSSTLSLDGQVAVLGANALAQGRHWRWFRSMWPPTPRSARRWWPTFPVCRPD